MGMIKPTWGGLRIETWGTDASQPPAVEQFGEDIEAAIDRAREISKTAKCRTVVVIAEGSSIRLAEFTGRWGLDRKW